MTWGWSLAGRTAGRHSRAAAARPAPGRAAGPRAGRRAGPGPRAAPVAAASRAARKRQMGADAAVGVRQLAQGLAAHAPARGRGLGVQPLGPRLLPRGRRAARAGARRPAGRRSRGLPARPEPLPLPPGPGLRFLFVGGTIFRKGIDLLLAAFARAFPPSDGDRPGDQGHGVEELLPGPDGRGAGGRSCESGAIPSSTSTDR